MPLLKEVFKVVLPTSACGGSQKAKMAGNHRSPQKLYVLQVLNTARFCKQGRKPGGIWMHIWSNECVKNKTHKQCCSFRPDDAECLNGRPSVHCTTVGSLQTA